MSRLLRPQLVTIDWDYQNLFGNLGATATFPWMGENDATGYPIQLANNFGGPIVVRKLWFQVGVALAQSNTVSSYVYSGTPAGGNKTHTVNLSTSSTGFVNGEDASAHIFNEGDPIWVQSEFPAGTYYIQPVQVAILVEIPG